VTATWNCYDPLTNKTTVITQSLSSAGANQSATAVCSDSLGISVTNTQGGIDIDLAPPTVTPVPARTPDHNGWYNHPLSVSWNGTDDLSGFAGCTPAEQTYSGPDSATAGVEP